MKTLETIKNELKDLVPQGTDVALEAIKAALVPNTDKYNDYLLLEGRYQDASKQLVQGVITEEDATVKFNQIRAMILVFIDGLRDADLAALAKEETSQPGMEDVYNGELLYRIPKQMAVGIEEECIVRLAFDRQKLLEHFEPQVGDVMKDLRIGDVMSVELLDPDDEKAFNITTDYDKVQFLDKHGVTEWIFCVTPLLEGHHQLVLKISIIEIIDGIERKRNEVLREKVDITAELERSTITEDFSPSGITWQVLSSNTQKAVSPPSGGTKSVPETVAPAPAPYAPPMPQVAPKSGGNLRKIATVLGALVAVVFIWAMFSRPNFSPVENPSPIVDNEPTKINHESFWDLAIQSKNRRALDSLVLNNPDSPQVQIAMMILDSLEDAAWNDALALNTAEGYEKYMKEYGNGRYTDAAAIRFDELTSTAAKPSDKQIVPEKKPTKQQPKSGQKPKKPSNDVGKTSPKPSTPQTNDSNSREQVSKDLKVEEKPDPNRIISVLLADRKPYYKPCTNDKNLLAEEKCTRDRIQAYLEDKMVYPKQALEFKKQGTVVVEFVIEKDGTVGQVKPLTNLGSGLEKEAVRLIKKLGPFVPGKDKTGKPIRLLCKQPVRFEID